jgi:RNA methyltransferase, TrmH family
MSMKLISSRDNPQYKELRQLATSAQARRKLGLTLLDGVHLCEAWLQHRGAPAKCVISEAARNLPAVARLAERCLSLGADCLQLPDALFAPLSQVEHGVALLFIVPVPAPQSSAQLPPLVDASAVLLDGLQDPGNLGSILRSAAAAGIRQVICGEGTAAAWSPKVLRAGMGAHFVLDIAEHADLGAVIANAKLPVFATSSHASASIYDTELAAPCAWLFGHEGAGVSSKLTALVTKELTIPQQSGVESMNVAAAAAVCLFEQRRQRLMAGRSP